MQKIFKIAQVKDLLNNVHSGEITFSRLVEILNETALNQIEAKELLRKPIDFAEWIVRKGYKYNQMSYPQNCGSWFLDAKSIGVTSSELHAEFEREATTLKSSKLPSIDLIRKIEIHIETTDECIENFHIPKYVKELLEQDVELYKIIIAHLKNN